MKTSQRLKSDLTLLFVAAIWGGGFAAQRTAAAYIGPFLFNASRFLLGAGILWLYARLFLSRQPDPASHTSEIDDRSGDSFLSHRVLLPGLAGSILFLGAWLQQAGIQTTTAGNAGFITGLYVVLVPILLSLFWHKRLSWQVWLAAGLASIGIYLLSTGGQFKPAAGDGLELAGALFWAFHVIVIDRASKAIDPIRLAIGQFIVCGLLNLAASVLFEPGSLPGLTHVVMPVLYTALFSNAMGFTLQIFGQRHAPPTDAAIILSMEAVFAAVAGFLVLSEALRALQLLGCGLILAGIFLASRSVAETASV